jgi:hypothetical protein
LFVPLVPTAVEVDPETPMSVVASRLPALVPSLLGLPERLVPAVLSLAVAEFSLTRPEVGAAVVPLAVGAAVAPLAIVAFESIQLSVRASVPRVRQPVTVTRCAAAPVEDDERSPLGFDGADFVAGC